MIVPDTPWLENLNASEFFTLLDQPEKFLVRAKANGCTLGNLDPLRITARPGEPYGRRLLVADAEWEVMLASWAPGIECAPHDHGDARGLVWFMKGDFLETNYYMSRHGLVTLENCNFAAGRTVQVRQSDIHSCRAHAGGLSLHFYFPRVRGMKVYDRESRQTLTVADSCGAWVPRSADDILEVQAWDKTLTATY
jgi:cysteine dioxygenase